MRSPQSLQGPEGRLTVSAKPRFLWHSGAVGWQGAFFAELMSAAAGVVDHAHEVYCLYRAHTAFRLVESGANNRLRALARD